MPGRPTSRSSAVRTDFRRGGDDPDATVNLMLSQAARVVVVPARDADTAVTPFVRSIVSALAEIGGPDPAR